MARDGLTLSKFKDIFTEQKSHAMTPIQPLHGSDVRACTSPYLLSLNNVAGNRL